MSHDVSNIAFLLRDDLCVRNHADIPCIFIYAWSSKHVIACSFFGVVVLLRHILFLGVCKLTFPFLSSRKKGVYSQSLTDESLVHAWHLNLVMPDTLVAFIA